MAKKRPRGYCAFCGVFEQLTREHVWGEWVAKYASPDTRDPVNHRQSQTRFTVDPDTGDVPIVVESQIHGGSLIRRRLPIACSKCNNGWMSQLEADMEELALPLIQGKGTSLDQTVQQRLALWLDKTACVYEHSDPQSQITTAAQRDQMRTTLSPAPNTEVWVARYSGDQWLGKIRHFGAGAPNPAGDSASPSRVNLRSDVLVIGELLGFVVGGDSDVLTRYGFSPVIDEIEFLQRVWPSSPDPVAFPPVGDPVSDAAAWGLADILAYWGGIDRVNPMPS